METIVWIGILICISQSATLSGLNLAFFSISRLQLEMESKKNSKAAQKVLRLREDSNFLLTTILWGNVGVNVLLALLSESIMAGVTAFLFSTVVITIGGEIIPQAYFSRHAFQTASLLSPVVRLYQMLLYPVAKPTALILDKWLGPEAIQYVNEKGFRELIEMHVDSPETEIDQVEGVGAINFLAMDDVPVAAEGEILDPKSVITLVFEGNRPVFPALELSPDNEFFKLMDSSGKKWVIVVDSENEPRAVIDADGFLRDALLCDGSFNPYLYCHRPIVIKDARTPLGKTISRLNVHPERSDDDVIDEDIIIFWGQSKRVITGSDILGRLLRGIVRKESTPLNDQPCE